MPDLDYSVEKTATLRRKYPSADTKAMQAMATSLQESLEMIEGMGQAVESLLHPVRSASQECAELERSVRELNSQESIALANLQSARAQLHGRKSLEVFVPAAPLEQSERVNHQVLAMIDRQRSELLRCCQACPERLLCPRLPRMNMD